MEILFYIIGVLIALGIMFLIIEYPYHFIGLFIFIIFYDFNVELPGPFDLRGYITIGLFLRLIVFDNENLKLITNQLFSNHIFLLVLLFELYFIFVTLGNTSKFITPVRVFIFQMIGLVLGFIAVYRGYVMQAFLTGIAAAGILGTIDLIYSFGVTSQLFVRRLIDVLIKSEYSTDLNHNHFGMLNGIAFVIVYILALARQINLKLSIILLFIFSTGILMSTSRGILITTLLTILISTIVFPKKYLDIKKLLFLGIKGVAFIILIISSYLLILSSLNVDNKFSEKIYYRFIEEPMGLIKGETSAFRGKSKYLQEGSASWRFNKALRDLNEFGKLKPIYQFFGFGYNGYFNISEKEFTRGDQSTQMSSHNGIATILIERGILGFVLFLILNIILLAKSLQLFKENITIFPFFIIIIFTFINTFGASSILLKRFGYIFVGGIIAQYIYNKNYATK